ncbi:MAG: transcriptional regulator [Pigmentiphaga sp.]|nr:transcriptional regulator [Pigmentiphaga sp.]
MTSPNPFVFPGLSATGNGNPLLQSLDMMRQAWGGMAQGAHLNPGLPTPITLNPGEIDRRIAELQAVENWLTLNLTMLQGTIRALEVQRATIATLRSFANLGAAGGAGPDSANDNAPSPLEIALGLKPAPGGASSEDGRPAPEVPGAEAPPAADQASSTNFPPLVDPAQAAAAQQAWWNLLQQQFNQIAGAAAASFPAAASADKADAGQPASRAATNRPKGAANGRAATKAAPRKVAAKRARKTPASR